MFRPTGPLPPTVYWRRRAAAIGALVVALVLLIWLVASVAGCEPGEPAGEQAAPPAAPPTTPEPTQKPTATAGGRPSEAPNFTESSLTGPPATVASSGAPAPSPEAAPQPSPQPPPPPPGPPQPCPDAVTAVAAQPERPEYRVGTKPVFRLAVTNTGPVACTRDLDAGLQELLVYAADGATRLWSSNDCYPGDSADVRTMQPGETVTFTVTWAGRSSRPGCSGQRVQIPAGDYLVVAKLGPLTSQPVPFRLLR